MTNLSLKSFLSVKIDESNIKHKSSACFYACCANIKSFKREQANVSLQNITAQGFCKSYEFCVNRKEIKFLFVILIRMDFYWYYSHCHKLKATLKNEKLSDIIAHDII